MERPPSCWDPPGARTSSTEQSAGALQRLPPRNAASIRGALLRLRGTPTVCAWTISLPHLCNAVGHDGRPLPPRRSFTLPAGGPCCSGRCFLFSPAERARHCQPHRVARAKTGFPLGNGASTAHGLFTIHGPRSLLPMKPHQHSLSLFCPRNSRNDGACRLHTGGSPCAFYFASPQLC